jgi:oligoribonuclease NrnB/cAMP/cGMP phosphodiesterase (DHH superfamily)
MIICFHHNDPDGYCAAAIVRLRHEEAYRAHQLTFISVDYKDLEHLDFSNITGKDEVIIVDFSFPPVVLMKLKEYTKKIIWIDHHATAKSYGYDDLPGLRDFTGQKSGCELTWEYYISNTKDVLGIVCSSGPEMPTAVRLIGDYDTWRMKEKAISVPFFEGLKSYDGLSSPASALWYNLLLWEGRAGLISEMIQAGHACIRYRRAYGAQIIKSFGYITHIDGIEAIAINCFGFGSLLFEDIKVEQPIKICYIFDGEKYTISFYSETVDVSVIARKLGGGGHRGASGCVRLVLPFVRERGINEAPEINKSAQ